MKRSSRIPPSSRAEARVLGAARARACATSLETRRWRKRPASGPRRPDLAHVGDVEDAAALAHGQVLGARPPRTGPASPSRRRARAAPRRRRAPRRGRCASGWPSSPSRRRLEARRHSRGGGAGRQGSERDLGSQATQIPLGAARATPAVKVVPVKLIAESTGASGEALGGAVEPAPGGHVRPPRRRVRAARRQPARRSGPATAVGDPPAGRRAR